MSEIKPCPFCGGEAIIKHSWLPNYKYVAVGCGSDMPCPAKNDEQDEQGGFSCEFPTEEEAINHWNEQFIVDKLHARIATLESELATSRQKLTDCDAKIADRDKALNDVVHELSRVEIDRDELLKEMQWRLENKNHRIAYLKQRIIDKNSKGE